MSPVAALTNSRWQLDVGREAIGCTCHWENRDAPGTAETMPARLTIAVLLLLMAPAPCWGHLYLDPQIGATDGDGRRELQVVLRANRDAVAHLENDLRYSTRFVEVDLGSCRINPTLTDCRDAGALCKTLTTSHIRCATRPRPAGCRVSSGVDIEHVRLAIGGNAAAIADGTVLYSCTLRRAPASSVNPLEIANLTANDPAGRPVTVSFRQAPGAWPTFPIVTYPAAWYAVPAPPYQLSLADLDDDGHDDAVVGLEGIEALGVVISDGHGSLRTLITLPLPDPVKLLGTGDLNGDGHVDIVVHGRGNHSLALIRSMGDGRFDAPQTIANGIDAQVLTLADLNNQGGPDVILGNTDGTLSTVLDVREGQGTVVNSESRVGTRFVDAEAADFNHDGFNDVCLLDGAGGEDAAVIIAFGDTRGGFTSTMRLAVPGALAMGLADFDGDYRFDVAVLTSTGGAHAISVFFDLKDDFGTPAFAAPLRIPLACGAFFGSIPVTCAARDLAAGDLDGDGWEDIAAIMAVSAAGDPSMSFPGLLFSFGSGGDGSFQPGYRSNIGVAPRELKAVNSHDYYYEKLFITDAGETGSVDGVWVNISESFGDTGDRCNEGTVCPNLCVDGVCCTASDCPANERCDIPAAAGNCSLPVDVGLCRADEHCASGFCVGGFCCATATCPEGQYCNSGQCTPPVALGNECIAGNECDSGACVDDVCCEAVCGDQQECDIPGHEGSCTDRLGAKMLCNREGQCAAQFSCTDGLCCSSENCGPGRACNVAGSEGVCASLATPSATPTPTPTPNVGRPCTVDGECSTGFCVDHVCCTTASCPAQQYCDVSTAPGACSPRLPIGSECGKHSDCLSANCTGILRCGPVFTPTPGFGTPPCEMDSQCGEGRFCNIEEGRVCCDHKVCPAGSSCRVPRNEGVCRPLPTPTPTFIPPIDGCVSGDVCESGNCVHRVCCQQPSCPAGTRCDIFGSLGHCAPLLPEGERCYSNSNCVPPLLCITDDLGALRCSTLRLTPTIDPGPPPTSSPSSTPTLSSTPTSTQTPTATRAPKGDDGCSMHPRARGGNVAWVLLGWTLAYALRVRANCTLTRRRAAPVAIASESTNHGDT